MADNTLDQFLDDQEAYDDGPAKGARAPILLTHFDGAMDAGTAGHLAIEQLLHTLDTQRVATFESDMFIDYRSHRPVMNIDDWVTTSLEVPEIALDLVYDDAGVPLLVLHGPEPDAKWETFVRAVSHLAEQAGVEISFSLHGIPSGVPHTRPTPVHMHATDGSLLPEQPQMSGTMRFPAPMTSFLQSHLASQGIDGVTMLAAVPYYMSDTQYPRAASALLTSLSDYADLSLPVGDLERGASEEIDQVTQLIEANEEVSRTIAALEKHYDALATASNSTETFRLPDSESSAMSAEDITETIEEFLRTRSQRSAEADATSANTDEATQGDEEDQFTIDDVLDRLEEGSFHARPARGAESESSARPSQGQRETVEDVLRRLRERSNDSEATERNQTLRHRADPTWGPPQQPSDD